MNKIVSILILALFIFSGCASNKGPEYDARSYNKIKQVQIGTVLDNKDVIIKDDNSGKFLGAIVGAVLGSTVGQSTGKTLATLGGGLAGGYVGGELGKANAEELTVELDNGEIIVVVAKVKNIVTGDRVRIIKDGNRVASVNKID